MNGRRNDMEQSFIKAKPIVDTLINHGYEAYFVGGSVRDHMLNRPIHDIDIATSATPDIVQSLFKSVIPVGIEHGTVIVVHEGQAYEVTTFRKESKYSDFRRPNEVTFISSLQEDLKRRDFTMNAIAVANNLEIIDPFNGKQDIHNQLIRTVGSPYERFQEDPLRMLRAIRFVAQLNFSIEKETLRAIDEMKPYLAHLSVERIAQEFEKLLLGQASGKALALIAANNVHSFLPCLKGCQAQIEKIAKLPLTYFKKPRECWTLLLFYIQSEPKEFLKAWKRPKRTIKHVETLLHALKQEKSKQWEPYLFYSLGRELSLSYITIYTVINEQSLKDNLEKFKKIYAKLPIKQRKELAVNGNDLVAFTNKKRGPWIKEVLNKIEQSIISGKLHNDKNEIREWVTHWHSQFE